MVREGGVWGEFCVNEGNGEEMGKEERSEDDGGLCSCFEGRFSVKRVYFNQCLVSGEMKGIGSNEKGTKPWRAEMRGG